MGPTLDEPQSFGQGSYFGRSWEYGGLYGIRSSRRNDWNDSQPERRHGQSLGRRKSELLVEPDLKDVSIISFHPWNEMIDMLHAKRMKKTHAQKSTMTTHVAPLAKTVAKVI